jgi:hypothetical protein
VPVLKLLWFPEANQEHATSREDATGSTHVQRIMLWLPLWEDSLHSTELPKMTEPRGERQIRTTNSFAGGSLLNTEVKAGKILHSLLTIHSSERSFITLQSGAVTMTACEVSRSPDFPEDGYWKVFFCRHGRVGPEYAPSHSTTSAKISRLLYEGRSCSRAQTMVALPLPTLQA